MGDTDSVNQVGRMPRLPFPQDIVDEGSFTSWQQDSSDTLQWEFVTDRYSRKLTKARRRTGQVDSVVTGEGLVWNRAIALIHINFRFLGGTIGVSGGESIARAFERAAQREMPLIGLVASGGMRLDEGTPAFLQMLKSLAAVEKFKASNQLFICYLSHPSLGGVVASWATMAHLLWAAPGARIGFAGPRVIEAVTGEAIAEDVQRSDTLLARGYVDEIVDSSTVRDRLRDVLGTLAPSDSASNVMVSACGHSQQNRNTDRVDPWESVVRTRDRNRPGLNEFLIHSLESFVPIGGDRTGGGDDPSCTAGLGKLGGSPLVVVGQTRDGEATGSMTPAGYRKSRRAIRLAAELSLPILTVVDTQGASLCPESEMEGMSWELAGCAYDLMKAPVPTVAVLLGAGAGGGALALLPADRVIAAEHAWLGPLPPEGSAAILFRSVSEAPTVSRLQRMAANDLKRFGFVDFVLPEPRSSSKNWGLFLDEVRSQVLKNLSELARQSRSKRERTRRAKYRDCVLKFVPES